MSSIGMNQDLHTQMSVADAKVQEAVDSVNPIALFLFCLVNPKFKNFLPGWKQPDSKVLYSSP